MPSKEPFERPTHHVAIFPPQTNTACKLETWGDVPIEGKTPSVVAEKSDVRGVFSNDEEEPERWDGMS